MSSVLHKKSILQKTVQVGSSTLLSRFFGILREILIGRYLGVGAIPDAFFTAFTIPNLLRKLFAEGALSAVFIPQLVSVGRQDKQQANSLISLGFLVFQGFLFIFCCLVICKAEFVLNLMVPGWGPERIALAVPMLRILMPFILCVSSSALLAGALQSVGHFFVPAFAPVLLNIVFIIGLLVCIFFSLPVAYLCSFIICGGILQFLVHLVTYFDLKFHFGAINRQAWRNFLPILVKFLPCLVSTGVMEFSLTIVDKRFASYLPAGSITLIHYASRFMAIPLGVFAVAFSTILLPHFSRIVTYAPKRLSFYLLETTKLVAWVTFPMTLLMVFFAEKIFHTLFLSEKFTLAHVYEAKMIFIAFSIGLVFLSLNKILLNMYFALHVTFIPTIIALLVALLNVGLIYCLMGAYQSVGIATAYTISIGMVQSLLFLVFLYTRYSFRFYVRNYLKFMGMYLVQLSLLFSIFYGLYAVSTKFIEMLPQSIAHFMLYSLGFWLWVGPLCGMLLLAIFYTRRFFRIKLYFLD